MALFLVQHGKSLPKAVDPDQGLSKDGITEVKRIAETAKAYGVCVAGIVHSGKKRARQTADIFAAALSPAKGVSEQSGLKPMDDIEIFAETVDTNARLMFVGHLPFMEKLTALLIAGTAEKPVFQFQNGGLVCLDIHPVSKSWVVKWALMPNIG